MKILLVGEFSFGSLGSSYSTGFKKLGHEIIKFDFVQESKMLNPFSVNKYLNKLFGHLYNYQINQRLLEKIKIIKPELILVLKGTSIYPEILMRIKETPETILFCFRNQILDLSLKLKKHIRRILKNFLKVFLLVSSVAHRIKSCLLFMDSMTMSA